MRRQHAECTNIDHDGWTVYDNFAIPVGIAAVTDFTYVSLINVGAWAHYSGTDWTLFGGITAISRISP